MEKAVDAFRTISEVATDLDVPKHVLRFWEGKFPQVKPMKRGGGRRFYRPEDVDLLQGIRRLLYQEGYTIKGVQRLIRENGLDFVKTFWKAGAGLSAPRPGGKDGAAGKARAGKPAAAKAGKRDGQATGSTAAAGLERRLAKQLRGVLAELEAGRTALLAEAE